MASGRHGTRSCTWRLRRTASIGRRGSRWCSTAANKCIRRSSALGADPQVTGKSFYVYYTDGSRWGNAQLARRLVTFDPSIPPILPPPPGPDPGPDPGQIRSDADGLDDHQRLQRRLPRRRSGPRVGSTPGIRTASLAARPVFTPLQWSESAQAYNTTGGATQAARVERHTTTTICNSAPSGAIRASRSTCRSPATRFRKKTAQASTA